MSGADTGQQLLPPIPPFSNTTQNAGNTAGMLGTSTNNGFRQAMLKSALNTIPQLTEENYSIWKDKMTALLELRGVLDTLQSSSAASTLATEVNAELKLLIIAKMDSVTHNNIS
ncbi:hypothetical protein PCANC_27408 [Puccinia coronata f. sp. avenae]|uniref:DUF4219 domain-containing protein n=1 Tax=Puccinia coronata f. sp. avenae TaxID=200324 RepID=A0A2N5RY47_9BASI|nr:hypothetical protein PCANC_27408 [Puccinia coronata f. sp. avenae]